jgi:hypothetical protein
LCSSRRNLMSDAYDVFIAIVYTPHSINLSDYQHLVLLFWHPKTTKKSCYAWVFSFASLIVFLVPSELFGGLLYISVFFSWFSFKEKSKNWVFFFRQFDNFWTKKESHLTNILQIWFFKLTSKEQRFMKRLNFLFSSGIFELSN